MKKGFDEEQEKENEVPAGPINLGDDDDLAEDDIVDAPVEEDEFALGDDIEEEEDDTPFGFGPAAEE